MNINTNLRHQTPEFEIFEVEIDGITTSVLINLETQVILCSTPGQHPARSQFRLSNWIFDNVRDSFSRVATISALAAQELPHG